jgi:hypothetical protein
MDRDGCRERRYIVFRHYIIMLIPQWVFLLFIRTGSIEYPSGFRFIIR